MILKCRVPKFPRVSLGSFFMVEIWTFKRFKVPLNTFKFRCWTISEGRKGILPNSGVRIATMGHSLEDNGHRNRTKFNDQTPDQFTIGPRDEVEKLPNEKINFC